MQRATEAELPGSLTRVPLEIGFSDGCSESPHHFDAGVGPNPVKTGQCTYPREAGLADPRPSNKNPAPAGQNLPETSGEADPQPCTQNPMQIGLDTLSREPEVADPQLLSPHHPGGVYRTHPGARGDDPHPGVSWHPQRVPFAPQSSPHRKLSKFQ